MNVAERESVVAKTRVAVIVPTRDEGENIDRIVPAVLEAFADAELPIELLIADGGSRDATLQRAEVWAEKGKLRVVRSDAARGLAGDVLAAVVTTEAEVVVVLDADLSHPARVAPRLAQSVLEGSCDMCIGSRYVPGGSTPDWPLARRVISRTAALLAWPLVDVRDPLSGFFAIRRDRLLDVDAEARGFKLGLEALVRGGDDLRVREIPIEFHDRRHGESKMGLRQVTAYLQRLLVLAGGAVGPGSAGRFAIVGILGLLVDLGCFLSLTGPAGLPLGAAHVLSFLVATVSNFVLNRSWVFPSEARVDRLRTYLRYVSVCLLALFLRGGVLATLVDKLHWPGALALVAAVFAAAAVNYLGSAFWVFAVPLRRGEDLRWRVAALGVIAFSVLLRMAYAGVVDLIPEEAYYWNYAQHADLAYLDHPPMIAWGIAFGTSLFGDTEIGVRLFSLLCWGVTVGFGFALARNLYGKSSALRVTLLLAVLPFFAASGFLATPDAPLTAAWAASLYFLERALVAGKRGAWWGLGVSIGLGMLSKYTIGLLAPATLAFVILHAPSRRWLRSPHVLGAALLSIAVFSPVLIWNHEHDWVSFAFQGTRRLAEEPGFGVHLLVVFAVGLLTPIAFLSAVRRVLGREALRSCRTDPRQLFASVMTLVPLSVFVVFCVRHSPQLNWTGPVWLAALPVVARRRVTPIHGGSPRSGRGWPATVLVTLLLGGALLHTVALGLPAGPGLITRVTSSYWREIGADVAELASELRRAEGVAPVVVGMDRYNLASELAFYARVDGTRVDVAGRNLFGRPALMYDMWRPPSSVAGRSLILVDLRADRLEGACVEDRVHGAEPVECRALTRAGHAPLQYYRRVVHGYCPPADESILVGGFGCLAADGRSSRTPCACLDRGVEPGPIHLGEMRP